MDQMVETQPAGIVPPQPRYAALDGLRGLAAYTVVVSHYVGSVSKGGPAYDGHTILEPLLQAGQVGVMLFFVISGFLMGALYMRTPWTNASARAFYVKRFGRVVPLYYLLVVVSFTLQMTLNSVWPFYYVDSFWRFMLFWYGGNNVLWTIPVEVQFYAFFPISRRGGPSRYGVSRH